MNCPVCGHLAPKTAGELLPIMEPKYNLREMVKQMTLLEDHLFHPKKRCPDCITKHLLCVEALAEELVTLDKEGKYTELAEAVADQMRMCQQWLLNNEPFETVAQTIREVRKGIQPEIMAWKVAQSALTKEAGVRLVRAEVDFPEKLTRWFEKETGIAPLSEVQAHHITLAYKPSAEVARSYPMGKRVKFKIVGWAENGDTQALVVQSMDSEVKSHRPIPHVTLSKRKEVASVYSNDLLSRGYTRVSGPVFTATVAWDDGSKVRTDAIRLGSKKASEVRELHIYDFDGTLFRSPHPPEWADKKWWSTYESLDVPNVPQKPDSSWWIGSTVSQAKKSIGRSDVVSVVITGRANFPSFRFRVAELLKQAGLNFDGVFLNDQGGNTKSTKLKHIAKILTRFPSIEVIHIWEDRGEHLSYFISTIQKAGLEAYGHLIKAEAKLPTPGRSGVDYIEMVLDPSSVAKLKTWFLTVSESKDKKKELYSDVYAHHVTIKHDPKIDDILDAEFGKKVKVQVTGWVDNGKIQAVTVDPKGFNLPSGRTPHITVATKGVTPVGANRAVKKAIPVLGPTLSGIIGFYDGTEHRTDRAVKVAAQWVMGTTHRKSVALMKYLSDLAIKLGVARHVYVVGGAVRNWVIDKPIKDIDVVIDSVALKGKDSEWFAKKLERHLPSQARVNVTTNQYGVAIVTVKGDWIVEGENLKGEVIEIANARKESYGGSGGKGYKPSEVVPSTIEEDVYRREFSFNTLLWRLHDLASGPDKAEIVDITGCGLRDLQEGVMKCPSGPDKTFSDDPTRMLRAVKFLTKYGFRIDADVKKSILRNAHKIKNVPQNAVAKLLIETLLQESTGHKAVETMKELGLLVPLADMIESDKAFRSTLYNWSTDQPLKFLYELLDLGFPLDAPTGFLTRSQQVRFKELAYTLDPDHSLALFAALKQPGKAYKDKKWIPSLYEEFGVTSNKLIGPFARKAGEFAREILLSDPELVRKPAKVKDYVLGRLRGKSAARQASAGLKTSLTSRVASSYAMTRSKTAFRFDESTIKQWKADLRRMTKIYRSIPVERTDGDWDSETNRFVPSPQSRKARKMWDEAKKLFQVYQKNIKDIVFGDLVPGQREGPQPGQADYLRTTTEKFLFELYGLFPKSWNHRTKDHRPSFHRLGKERANNIRKYQKASKDFFYALGRHLEVEGGPVTHQDRAVRENLAGFQTVLYLAGPEQRSQVKYVEAGLKAYRKAAQKYAPILITRQLPLEIHPQESHRSSEDAAATYEKTFISLWEWSTLGSTIPHLVQILAHEMGHHIFQTVLSKEAQEFWKLAIKGDYKDLDLRDVMSKMRSDETLSAFSIRIEKSDPILNLKLDTLAYHRDFAQYELYTTTRIKEYLDEGRSPIVPVPAHPITAYAGKNAEESFCEALGMLVGYGPRAVFPKVRGWLNKIVPGIKVSSQTALTAAGISHRYLTAKFKNKKQVDKADGSGKTTVYEYSDRQVSKRNNDKAERIEKLRKNIGKLRSQYKKDLSSSDPVTRLSALVVALIDETYERVGNDGSAKEGHFGVTGWQAKHISLSGSKATIKYVGKSGVKQSKTVSNKSVVSALKKALKGKSGSDCVFHHEDGKVTSDDVNTYLEGFGITAKDMRGFHANVTMCQNLKRIRSAGPELPSDPKKKKELLKKEFDQALEEASNAVGHEASTLKSQYLVPGLEDGYMKDGSVEDKLKLSSVQRVAGQYADIMAGYYRDSNTRIEIVAHRWQEDGDKLYDDSMPIMVATSDLWKHREYTWTRDKARSGRTLVDGKSFDLPGPLKWDALKSDMSRRGWDANDPAIVEVGRKGGMKVGEGNHRLAIAREIGISKIPVRVMFYDRKVSKSQTAEVVEVSKPAVVQSLSVPKPMSPEKTERVDVLMKLLGMRSASQVPVPVVRGPVNTRPVTVKVSSWTTEETRALLAKKDQYEQDEEQAEKQIKPAPKLKPPRYDLRNRRLRDEDTDTEGQGAEKDRDLSLNYKRVASAYIAARFAASFSPTEEGAQKLLEQHLEKHPDSEKTKEDFFRPGEDSGTKEEDSETRDEAKEEELGKKDPKEEEEAAEAKEEVKEEELKKTLDEASQSLELGGLSNEVKKSFSEALSELKESGKKEAAEAYTSSIDELIKMDDNKADLKALRTSLTTKASGSPQEIGKQLAMAHYADRVTFNPMSAKGSEASFQKWTSMKSGDREKASEDLQSRLEGSSKEEVTEIRNRLNGIKAAAIVAGDTGSSLGEPEPSKAMQGFVKSLSLTETGREALFSKSGELTLPDRTTVHHSLSALSNEDFLEVMGSGPGSPNPSPLAALLKDPKMKKNHVLIRSIMTEFSLDDAAIGHYVVRDSLRKKDTSPSKNKGKGKPTTSEPTSEEIAKGLNEVTKSVVADYRSQLEEDHSDEDMKSLEEELQMERLKAMSEMGDPTDDSRRLLDDLINVGDLSRVDIETDPPLAAS